MAHSEQGRGYGQEERRRAHDRLAVRTARTHRHRARLLWFLVGPGILAMLGENDAPSMLSYAATGSEFGIGFFLPFILLTFAMAYVTQEMTVRLGAVSQAGHAELIYRRFGRFWGHFAMGDLLLTNFLTLVTEFVGIRAGAGFFGVPPVLAVGTGVLIVILSTRTRRYWSWERLTLALAVGNLVFVPVALLAHPNWQAVGQAFVRWGPLPGGFNHQTILLLLADIGATITPWMLFFQQGAVTDKGLSPQDIAHGRWDTALGSLLAATAAIAAVIATSPLYLHHMTAGRFNAAQFAQALVPYAGRAGGTLFALGIWEAGLVATLTIATSSAYAFGEVANQARSLNRPFREAPGFYLVLTGMTVLAAALVIIPGFPLEPVVLTVNVIAVLTMPPALGFLLVLVNDPDIVGRHRNTRWLNVLGLSVAAFVCLAGVIYALTVLLPGTRF